MKLDDYRNVAGTAVVEDLWRIAGLLKGKSVVMVNSTAVGGGVAEILNRMVPLLQDAGIHARWEVFRGDEPFFGVTKRIHNGLHGEVVTFQERDRALYDRAQEANLNGLNLHGDIVFIHDPQPAGLIRYRKQLGGRWIWRCHVDVSNPDRRIWNFLKPMVEQFDASIFSAPSFSRRLSNRQVLVAPSIDPLSDKNKELDDAYIQSVVRRFHLDPERPIVTQVSRFDHLKDPIGVIHAYQQVRPYIDCQLVLVGGSADDDPEGAQVLAQVKEAAGQDTNIHIIELPPTSHLEINALQRASTVILQKSIREGFGLTVTEALWKGKPVIASAVGGIPLQITHKYSGILTQSIDGTAYWLKALLQSPDFAKKLGENGRAHVRDNFLLTRHLRDYLLLFASLEHDQEDVVCF